MIRSPSSISSVLQRTGGAVARPVSVLARAARQRRDASRAAKIVVRSDDEIARIRRAGRVVHAAIGAAAAAAVDGASTAEINDAAAEVIDAVGAVSLFRDYPSYHPGDGFPGEICVSVNEEVVHGIPGSRRLAEGDIVTIDCGVMLDDWCCDAARTLCIGHVAPELSRMIAANQRVLELAIEAARPGARWSDIARMMQVEAESVGYGVVREYVGHGIGRQLHEPPQVPGFVSPEFLSRGDFTLRPGMVIAIEPMLTLGSPATAVLEDGWTVVTADGLPACHVEHTITITRDGAAVLSDGN